MAREMSGPPSTIARDGGSVEAEDLERLRRAYQAGRDEKQKGIKEFVERSGLTPPEVYKLAFNNGFTTLGTGHTAPLLPAEAEKILREAAPLGRRVLHRAIHRAMRVLLQYPRGAFGQVTPALLWKQIRKYQARTAHRRYERAHWSREDLDTLVRGYDESAAGLRRCVRELMRRHPGWSRDQIHWKACALRLSRRTRKGKALKPWSEKEDMTLISLATLKPIASIARKLDRSPWAVRCRLAGLRVSGRVAGQDYGCEFLLSLLRIGRRRLHRLIGSKKLKCTGLRVSRRSVEEYLRNQKRGIAPDREPKTPSTGRSPMKKYYTFQKAAARLGVTPQRVSELLAEGFLKPYRPRVSEADLGQFLEKYGWQLQPDSLEFDSLDCEPQHWVKHVPALTPQEAASLAKLRAQRMHTRTVRNCRYCGRELRGNACGFHEKRCGERSKPQPPARGPAKLRAWPRYSM